MRVVYGNCATASLLPSETIAVVEPGL